MPDNNPPPPAHQSSTGAAAGQQVTANSLTIWKNESSVYGGLLDSLNKDSQNFFDSVLTLANQNGLEALESHRKKIDLYAGKCIQAALECMRLDAGNASIWSKKVSDVGKLQQNLNSSVLSTDKSLE